MKTVYAAIAATLSLAAANPAQATSFTFDLTNGGTTATNNAAGNVRTYSATTAGQTLGVKATGWSIDDGRVYSASLRSYSQGLGVTNRTDLLDLHTIDNIDSDDFVLLQFSQAVTLTSAVLNPYTLFLSLGDNDSTVKWGTMAGAWDQALALNGMSRTSFNGLFAGTVDIASNGTAKQSFNIIGSGNMWMIGASQANPDIFVDGFKLASVSVTTTAAAVPEPATWAMMLLGFGMVDAAARYRRRSTAARVTIA